MDPSTRLAYILSEVNLTWQDVTPEEWLEVLKKALDLCKPYLKYFSAFFEIKEHLNQQQGAYDHRETDLSLVKFPPGMGPDTRLITLAYLAEGAEGKNPAGSQFGARFSMKRALLLTRKGEWVYWYAKYDRIGRQNLGHRSHHDGVIERAVESAFSILDFESLLVLLQSGSPPVFPQVLWALHRCLHESISEKTKRLKTLERVGAQITEMVQRSNAHLAR